MGRRHIVYSCDSNYWTPLFLSVWSICNGGYITDCCFHIIEKGVTDPQKQKLKDVVEMSNNKIEYYSSPILPKSLKPTGRRTEAAYYRICVTSILPEIIDKILYIDCDTFVCRSINALYDLEMKGNIVYGLHDVIGLCDRVTIGLNKNEKYINSGVLLIDLNKWREKNVQDRFLRYLEESNYQLENNDQDLINHVCRGNIGVFVDPSYNVISSFFEYNRKQLMKLAGITDYYTEAQLKWAIENPTIIHFTGAVFDRPWLSVCEHPLMDYYRSKWKESGLGMDIEKYELTKMEVFKRRIHKLPFPLYFPIRVIGRMVKRNKCKCGNIVCMMKHLIGFMFYKLGYYTPGLFCRLREYCKSMYCSGAFARGLKACGKNLYIQAPAIISGKQYIKIGDNFRCFSRSRIEAFYEYKGDKFLPDICIGNDVSINFDFHLGCINRIYIGNGVLIGSGVTIVDHNHGRTEASDVIPVERPLSSCGEVVIEDNVWIGEKVTILPGTKIGKNSIVGANAVVKGEIPDNSIVAGVPGKVLKNIAGIR